MTVHFDLNKSLLKFKNRAMKCIKSLPSPPTPLLAE